MTFTFLNIYNDSHKSDNDCTKLCNNLTKLNVSQNGKPSDMQETFLVFCE